MSSPMVGDMNIFNVYLADFESDDELRSFRVNDDDDADDNGCRIGDTGLFGSNKSIGGDSQSSQLSCWIFGARGLDGGDERPQAIIFNWTFSIVADRRINSSPISKIQLQLSHTTDSLLQLIYEYTLNH